MPVSNPDLWAKIRGWPLPFKKERDEQSDPARWCSCFEHNLRKLGDWTDEASVQITEAYRRFLYLKALTGETLTPPTWIDRAWHLHLGFREDYSALERAVGRTIPHNESVSVNDAERAYMRGHALWAAEFDAPPEREIWPSTNQEWLGCIGTCIAGLGVAVGIAGGVASFVAERPILWIFGSGVALFFIGAMVAGNRGPDTVSRCG